MNKKIAVIPGDGIGVEVVKEAIKVLDAVGEKFGHTFSYEYLLAGGCAIDATGKPLPEETLEKAKQADSVLLGAVGGPKWDNIPGIRPEQALLGLRGGLGLYANLRPAVMYKELASACPLKSEITGDGIDIMIVRELTGGIYFGESGRSEDGNSAYDTESYSKKEIERLLIQAFEIAMKRNKHVTVVDKANILETSRMWREVTRDIMPKYPEVKVDYLYVDNASMQLVRNPLQFDVIATSNIFGDILSDEASQITGSIGMLPSASLGEGTFGMYEPVHGSAPDIAGKNIANPLATILSVAMMLRYSFAMKDEADCIENAVQKALSDGLRTGDIAGGKDALGTKEMGDAVVARL
ncbi:MAG: 3-isopropylmalate dehydrogenase [Clostridia bacterium]|nr:3-isopropylmalate dehydrogenase [Clostridia bacterium]